MASPLYLVDVSSLYFRAFYAIRPLSNSKGMPTNALYGFLSMSTKLLREIKPDHMVYCFDSKLPGFRKEIYSEYKANRKEMPEDLIPQVPFVKTLTEALGIPVAECDACEADDIIGTLTHKARQKGFKVIIVSSDKDFAQLVGPSVSMFDTMKDITYDVEGVKGKWGIRPDQMVDYLALIGDASDNIPGVKGIGPKGAEKLLSEFNHIEDIYSAIETLPANATRKKLEESRESAFLSKKLATIVTDLPIPLDVDDWRLKQIEPTGLRALLAELDFKSFEPKLLGISRDGGMTAATTAPATASVESQPKSPGDSPKPETSKKAPTPPKNKTAREESSSLQGSFDLSSDEIKSEPRRISDVVKSLKFGQTIWAMSQGREIVIAFENQVLTVVAPFEELGRELAKLDLKWKGFNLKSLWHSIQLPIDPAPTIVWDQMLAAYLLRAGDVGRFEEVYEKYIGPRLHDFMEATTLYRAHQELEAKLREEIERLIPESGFSVLKTMDQPVSSVLYAMESEGVLLDQKLLTEESQSLAADIRQIELSIYEMIGEEFNIASPKQLSQILFEKLKMPHGRKTKTGFSTDSDVLEKLADEFPVAQRIMEYRELTKLKSTYVDALPELISPTTQRVHTTFDQALTATGRLSSHNPNLQNIPIRTERGSRIRKAFTVPEGCLMISADYSQIELRVLAHVTGDPGLTRAFKEDLDIHAATASEVFGVPLNEVTPDLRRVAKEINFGIAYGMGAFGLSSNLRISMAEANDIIKKYFQKFSRVRDYIQETIETAKSKGYVETLLGRRRYLDELKSSNANTRQFGERAAINAPIQGTASDIVKKAMIDIQGNVTAKLLLQVHDELILEATESNAVRAADDVKNKMENAIPLDVPLKVNVGVGRNWAEAH